MVVRYNGAKSNIKPLPGGGPKGTLLGLLLFLVLINDAGFSDQINNVGEMITSRKNFKAANLIHLKYVDDLTIAESIKLKEKIIRIPDEELINPVNFHDRTGHKLPIENSQVYKQLN